MKSYADAVQFLYDLRLFGAKLGLENTFRLAELAGRPQERLRFIHVAGTNGKGSVCAMLESVYRATGFRVGLYTSPHLISFCERIQVNRQMISEAEVVRLVEYFAGLLPRLAPVQPTFFEVTTVMAMKYFAEQKCDLVAWETGLGGRLDATNIVNPLASVITNVELDHEKWLGNSHLEIAREKAGIIKKGVPVITGCEEAGALKVIQQKAEELGCQLRVVDWKRAAAPPLDSIELSLEGDHQRMNAAIALETVKALQPILAVPEAAIRRGLSSVEWAGRLQRFRDPDGNEILLDGAHNPDSTKQLYAWLTQQYPEKRFVFIIGVLLEKHWESMFATLAPIIEKLYLTPVSSERSADPQDLANRCRAVNPRVPVQACSSLAEALQLSKEEPFRVLTGSIHFVGEALELLNTFPATGRRERNLNDWTFTKRER